MTNFAIHNRGYSLFEVLLVSAVVAAMGTLALPLLDASIAQGRVKTAAYNMFTDLQYARSAAIAHQQTVVICPSFDGRQCARSPQWERGSILFVDLDHNRMRSNNEPLLKIRAPLPAGLLLRFRRPNRLYYKPNGSAWPNGHFRVCSKSAAAQPRSVIIYRTGRNRLSKLAPRRNPIDCPLNT